MNAKRRAPYVPVVGIEGCGKSTQWQMLRQRVSLELREMTFTREPGGTELGERIREVFLSPQGMEADPRTQCYLNLGQRRENVRRVVAPSINAGVPVFSDRGDACMVAIQGYGRQALDLVPWMLGEREAVFDGYEPTLYIFIDTPPDKARARVMARGGKSGNPSGFDAQSIEFYQRVRDGYHAFFDNTMVPVRVAVVNGDRSEREVHEEIYAIVKEECGWQ